VRRLIAYFVRFAIILFGYVVAALAASAFLNILVLAHLGYTPANPEPAATASLYFSVPFVALFAAYFAFIPAIVVILIAELLGRRDWLFYALAGAVVAGVFLAFVHQDADVNFDVTEINARLAIVGSGMIGGIFYWLCAGRWAGSWRRAPLPEPEP
jgi:hypothetical protein